MIFGRTAAEKEALRDAAKRWHKAYAFFPERLIDGRWVWLEPVERISYWAPEIDRWVSRSGCWCYRLPSNLSDN